MSNTYQRFTITIETLLYEIKLFISGKRRTFHQAKILTKLKSIFKLFAKGFNNQPFVT